MTSESNRSKKFLAFVAAFLAMGFLRAGTAAAQPEPFEEIYLSIVGGTDFYETELHETWRIPAVAELSLGVPFYIGNASISATYLPAASRFNDITDFWAIYAGAGLEYPVPLGSRIELLPGFRFGSMYMNFQDEPVDFRKEESEIFVGAELTLSAAVTRSVHVQVSSSLLHTFTEIPIDVSLFNFGIEYRFDAPGWFRRALQ